MINGSNLSAVCLDDRFTDGKTYSDAPASVRRSGGVLPAFKNMRKKLTIDPFPIVPDRKDDIIS